MFHVSIENRDFAAWRAAARRFLQANVAPEAILWTNSGQSGLFAGNIPTVESKKIYKVPADFLRLAKIVACADAAEKWDLLYRLLFRLAKENRNLLEIESDADVRAALLYEKAIRRDVHKFHAFVRFRQIADETGAEKFVAWHEPAHFTVEIAAPFFVRRFGSMRFAILTPKGCADWDLKNLTFAPGVSAELAPVADETEIFWKTYYRSIFNPTRLKVKAMKAEMPIRFWRNLPEAALIPDLIREAEIRTREMLKHRHARAKVIKKLTAALEKKN
jgi:probable DNA metabolism protein